MEKPIMIKERKIHLEEEILINMQTMFEDVRETYKLVRIDQESIPGLKTELDTVLDILRTMYPLTMPPDMVRTNVYAVENNDILCVFVDSEGEEFRIVLV